MKEEIVSIDSISATANAKSEPKKIKKKSTSEDDVSQKNSRVCILCSDSHPARLCTKYRTAAARIGRFLAIKGVHPCTLCFSAVHSGSCSHNKVCNF